MIDIGERLAVDMPTAVLDFESTGLSIKNGDRVVEVGIIRASGIDDPNPERFSSFVNPGIPMPAKSWQIHQIDDAMVAHAPVMSAVLPEIRRLLSGAVVVAHHAVQDLEFLDHECRRANQPNLELPWVMDTLHMARGVFGFPRCGLQPLAKRMTVVAAPAHRALPDAQATLGIYGAMLRALDPDGKLCVDDLIGWVRSMRPGGEQRHRIRGLLDRAAISGNLVEIDYTRIHGPGPLSTRRRITVEALHSRTVEAYCICGTSDAPFVSTASSAP